MFSASVAKVWTNSAQHIMIQRAVLLSFTACSFCDQGSMCRYTYHLASVLSGNACRSSKHHFTSIAWYRCPFHHRSDCCILQPRPPFLQEPIFGHRGRSSRRRLFAGEWLNLWFLSTVGLLTELCCLCREECPIGVPRQAGPRVRVAVIHMLHILY